MAHESDVKQFALEVAELFNELLQPEFKHDWKKKIWDALYKVIPGMIRRKNDEQLNQKLIRIYLKFHSRFSRIETSIEAQAFESLGAIKIPPVGQMHKDKQTPVLSQIHLMA